MLHREHLRLSLEIELEANALIINSGAKAYSVARQRAEEASIDEMANDWNGAAAAISRRTWKRSHLLALDSTSGAATVKERVPMRLLIFLAFAAFALAGCNVSQTPNASTQGLYNPIDYAQTSGFYAGSR